MNKYLHAFPFERDGIVFTGMSLRDYYAGKALQGLLANPKLQNEILKQGGCKKGWIETSAWAFADAMLEAREQE